MTEPSNAELVRRIEDLVKSVERLTRTMENTYATKEAVQRVEEVHAGRLAELEKDNDARAGQVRQITAALIGSGLLLLISIIIQLQGAVGGIQR